MYESYVYTILESFKCTMALCISKRCTYFNLKYLIAKNAKIGVPVVAHWLKTQHSVCEDAGLTLASLSGLRIWHCCKLQHKSQIQLRSCVAVAGSCSSDLTPSPGTSICCRCDPKKTKRVKRIKKLKIKKCQNNDNSNIKDHRSQIMGTNITIMK